MPTYSGQRYFRLISRSIPTGIARRTRSSSQSISSSAKGGSWGSPVGADCVGPVQVREHEDVEQLARAARESPRKWRNPRGRKGSASGVPVPVPFSGEETEDGSAWTLNRFRQSDSMPR